MESCKVFVDSPMAIAATKLYKHYLDENFPGNTLDDNIFDFPQLTYVSEQSQSIGLNEIKSRAIIISASGMATGGRIWAGMPWCQSIWRAISCLPGFEPFIKSY
jgi:metallo-beta-lactamase family protein